MRKGPCDILGKSVPGRGSSKAKALRQKPAWSLWLDSSEEGKAGGS